MRWCCEGGVGVGVVVGVVLVLVWLLVLDDHDAGPPCGGPPSAGPKCSFIFSLCESRAVV